MKRKLGAIVGVLVMAVLIMAGTMPVFASTQRECQEAGYKYHGGWCYSRKTSSVGPEEAKTCSSDGGTFRKAGSEYYCVIDVSSHGSPGDDSGLNGGSEYYNNSSDNGADNGNDNGGDNLNDDEVDDGSGSGVTWNTDNSSAKGDSKCGNGEVYTNFFGGCVSADNSSVFMVLNVILQVLTWGIGIAGTVGIVITGFQYMTARDDVTQMTKAKNRLIQIVIGLAIYAVMWAFLQWLLPGGVFGS